MGKKRIDERICRDCGRLIFGRRVDAIVCKDCRKDYYLCKLNLFF